MLSLHDPSRLLLVVFRLFNARRRQATQAAMKMKMTYFGVLRMAVLLFDLSAVLMSFCTVRLIILPISKSSPHRYTLVYPGRVCGRL